MTLRGEWANTSPGETSCGRCGGEEKVKTCTASLWEKFTDAGWGNIKRIGVRYCPVCDPEPPDRGVLYIQDLSEPNPPVYTFDEAEAAVDWEKAAETVGR